MVWRQIDRDRWAPFFQQVAKSLVGKQAAIEVLSLDLGDQIQTRPAPLIGVSYDERGDLIELALERLDHLIRAPREVFADSDVGGLVALAIVDGDGRRQIVRVTSPLALPGASGPSAAGGLGRGRG